MGRIRKFLVPALVALIVLIAVSAPLVYALRMPSPKPFWDNAMGNLFATAVALLAAIPVALWLSRRAAARAARHGEQSRRECEKALLALLKQELSLNLKFVGERQAKPDQLHRLPLKSDLWNAAAASENLRLFSSLKLLDELAGVYYMVRLVRRIEEQAYRALASATVTYAGGKTAAELTMEDAALLYGPLKTSIADGLKELQLHEKSLA